ncbi:MAG: Spy/CpxP family protein refolding chaperone [Glaciimonas sp.]|nr:Spy/CpxP family protein refolding chaperone [Glaciimonas sp.]
MLKLKFRKQLLVSVAALSIAAFGSNAMAQTTGDAAASAPSVSKSMQRATPSPEQRAKFAEHMAKREAKLHDALKITAAQEGAWQTFTGQMKPPHTEGMQRPSKAVLATELATLTAPELMDKRLARMQKMQEHMVTRAAAVKTFYTVLTPEQQAIFNKHFHQMHGGFGHRGMHGKRGGAKDANPDVGH